jgi:hypothetical protein
VSATLSSSIICHVPASAGGFTVPDYLTRGIVQGQGTISVGSFRAPALFNASGLDVGTVTAGASTVIQTSFRTPPGGSNP